MDSEPLIIKDDNICPVTGTACDDECCSPGSECNLSASEIVGASEIDLRIPPSVTAIHDGLIELQAELNEGLGIPSEKIENKNVIQNENNNTMSKENEIITLSPQDLAEGNQTIALFMDYQIEYASATSEVPTGALIAPDKTSKVLPINLKFHLDWNELIPVIDKIEELPIPSVNDQKIYIQNPALATVTDLQDRAILIYPNLNNNNEPDYELYESRILATWMAVLVFLDWFNGGGQMQEPVKQEHVQPAQEQKPIQQPKKKKFDILEFATEFNDANIPNKVSKMKELDALIAKELPQEFKANLLALKAWAILNQKDSVSNPPTADEISKYLK